MLPLLLADGGSLAVVSLAFLETQTATSDSVSSVVASSESLSLTGLDGGEVSGTYLLPPGLDAAVLLRSRPDGRTFRRSMNPADASGERPRYVS